jgi:hypothetical protein
MTSQAISDDRRRGMLNAAMDAYLDWRDQCAAVSKAYRAWAAARKPDSEPAWRAYVTALEDEARASATYAAAVHVAAAITATHPTLAARTSVS